MEIEYLKTFYAFILIFVIEAVLLYLFNRKEFKVKTIVYYALLINLFTWPISQMINNYYSSYGHIFVITIGTFIVEWGLIVLLFRKGIVKGLFLSILVNFISMLVSIGLINPWYL